MSARSRYALYALLLAVLPVQAAERIRHVVLVDGGKQAGEQVVERGADGWTTVRFTYKDNGRGPEISERYRLAADGGFAEDHATGKTTFGSEVKDDFIRTGNEAQWTSTSETGRAPVQ